METEKDMFQSLLAYLQEHGYPPESLAVEYPTGKYRVDLAVIDPDSGEPLALFEIKAVRNVRTEEFGRRQIRSYLSALGAKSIPTYLVFPRSGTPPFEIVRVSIGEEEKDRQELKTAQPEQAVNFTILRASSHSALLAEAKQKRKRSIDILTVVCSVIAGVLGVVLRLDTLGKISISSTHLTIGGAIIALILVPFARKIKFLGIELKD